MYVAGVTIPNTNPNSSFSARSEMGVKPNPKTVRYGDVNPRWTAWRRSDYFYPEMIPEPDYSNSESDEDENDSEALRGRLRPMDAKIKSEEQKRRRIVHVGRIEIHNNAEVHLKPKGVESSEEEIAKPKKQIEISDEELIKPKKPANPYLESTELQKLHKELKFNQKYGKQSNGGKKTELQAALEKYTEGKIKKDLAASRRSSLEKILEQQARKIEMERDGTTDVQPAWIQELQRQHIAKRTDPMTDEFYRVHARVVSNTMNHPPKDESTASDMSSAKSTTSSESSD
ncbi:hypothetical protein CDAR_374471 [Caerostris darwini]|uniref:Uncharacterized protein n=1 Tax=Caerostris darwini TaxID=1538125 RepID=A0AAV4UIN7_9ARAC|nr:hypothetical protein CDAR_374471 [Caerostris darwini]